MSGRESGFPGESAGRLTEAERALLERELYELLLEPTVVQQAVITARAIMRQYKTTPQAAAQIALLVLRTAQAVASGGEQSLMTKRMRALLERSREQAQDRSYLMGDLWDEVEEITGLKLEHADGENAG